MLRLIANKIKNSSINSLDEIHFVQQTYKECKRNSEYSVMKEYDRSIYRDTVKQKQKRKKQEKELVGIKRNNQGYWELNIQALKTHFVV